MMNNRLAPYLLLTVGAAVLTALAAFLSGQAGVWGGLIGFVAGIAVSQGMFQGLRKAINEDMSKVLIRYMVNLLIRWGFVALFVVIMIRWFSQGLIFAVFGFVLGLLASIFVMALKTTHGEKGGER
jgi:hypothetical protein